MLPRSVLGFAAALAIMLVFVGCNNSPTVPLPPPDMTEVTTNTPDEEGYVTVTGGANAAEPDSVVLLYNETAKYGVMEAAGTNGGFEASVQAATGDSLVLQYKLVDEISYAKYIEVK
jgi:hypothetical protein